MKSVTYRGPEDPRDRTTRYVLDGQRFPKGVAEVVPDEVAAAVQRIEGHTFEIADAEGTREVTSAAAKLAAEEDIDLDLIEGVDQIGVEDIRAAIKARDENPDA